MRRCSRIRSTPTDYTDSYVGELAWVVTPKFFVNTNVGYFVYDNFQVTDTQFFDELRHTFSNSNTCTGAAGSSGCPFPEIPASLQQLNGYADKPASTRNVRDKFGRVGVNVDGTYYASFKGQHTLKAGVQWERLSNDVLIGAQAPTVAINWNASRTTLDDPPRQVRGTYGYYTVSRTYTEGKIHSNNVGFFLQDAWTISNRLTLNLGLRSDAETIPSYQPENPSLEFGIGDKIAPRVGFAYDIKGDGQWKAYGSWGLFYDISKLEMPRGAWGADHWIDYHYTLDSLRVAVHQLRRTAGLGLRRQVHRAGRSPARLERCEQQPDRSESQADPHAGVHARRRPRADALDVGRRPLRAQVARPDDRRRRHPGRRRRRSVHDRQPRIWHRRIHAGRAAARRARRSRGRSASTTASSSACASACRTTGR